MYTVDYFIKKFEAIPEEDWNDFVQYDTSTQTRCALGHCDPFNKNSIKVNGLRTAEGMGLVKLFDSVGFGMKSGNWITYVNNGRSVNYLQPTPKKRILAALYDIKKLQTKDIDTGGKAKERIVYVSVPATITEQAKELIKN
jgi:hypothetical protein